MAKHGESSALISFRLRGVCWTLLMLLLPAAQAAEPARSASEPDTAVTIQPEPSVSISEPLPGGILQLQLAMGAGRLTATELVDYYLQRIATLQQPPTSLNAVREVNAAARARAQALDAERRAKGPRGPLHGIPILIKDNMQTAGLATTAGSKLLEDFRPDEDAYQVAQLRAAGAIILGKTNMHEFGLGSTGLGSMFGSMRNPYALDRSPADGAAAAVAAGFAVAALGTDTCGGLRSAAAHNALVTLRGTQGLSSRAGVIPVSHTQDMVGPLATSVTDLALLLDATVGFDPSDRQSALSLGKIPASYSRALDVLGLQGKRIGVLEDLLLVDREDSAVVAVFGAAVAELRAAGAVLERIQAPELIGLMDSRVSGFFVLAHDFRTDIAGYLRTHRNLKVDNVDDILRRGVHHQSIDDALRLSEAMDRNSETEYLAELEHRRRFRELVMSIMAHHNLDALAYPAMRQVAAPLLAPQPGSNCRLSANTGLPAISIPAGYTPQGLPVGLELLGPSWSESELLSMAFSFEQATRHRQPPVLLTDVPRSQSNNRADPDLMPEAAPEPR